RTCTGRRWRGIRSSRTCCSRVRSGRPWLSCRSWVRAASRRWRACRLVTLRLAARALAVLLLAAVPGAVLARARALGTVLAAVLVLVATRALLLVRALGTVRVLVLGAPTAVNSRHSSPLRWSSCARSAWASLLLR